MKYKKLLSASFATLLLVNIGGPIVANATAEVDDKNIDLNLLAKIFKSDVELNGMGNVVIDEESEKVDKNKDSASSENSIDKTNFTDDSKESILDELYEDKEEEVLEKKEIDSTINKSYEQKKDSGKESTESEEYGEWGTAAWKRQLQDDGVYLYTIFSGETGSVEEAPWKKLDHDALKVIFEGEVVISNGEGLFKNENLVSIEGQNVVCTESTAYMFEGANKLTNIDLSSWDMSKVRNMKGMFKDASDLITADLSGWSTGIVSDMSDMFSDAVRLETVDISGWIFSFAMDMTGKGQENMFLNTRNLSTLKMNNIIVLSDRRLELIGDGIFQYTTALTTLEVKNWNVTDVRDLTNLYRKTFVSLPNITRLDLSGWKIKQDSNFPDGVQSFEDMFNGVSHLESINLSGWNMSPVKYINRMFRGCTNLRELKVDWNMSKITEMSGLFDGAGLEKIDASGWDLSKVVNMNNAFANMDNLYELDISKWKLPKEGIRKDNMLVGTSNIEILKMNDLSISNDKDLYTLRERIFQSLNNITILELKNWDVSNCTTLEGLYEKVFNSPEYASKIDLSGWDTPNVIDMSNLFKGANKLKSINLVNWNTSNVEIVDGMFEDGDSIESIDLSGWNIDRTVSMKNMFREVNKLERLTLGDDIRFNLEAGLNAPASSKNGYIASWTREDGNSAVYTPKEFMERFGSGELTGGTYVASEVVVPYTVSNFKSDIVTIGETSAIYFDWTERAHP